MSGTSGTPKGRVTSGSSTPAAAPPVSRVTVRRTIQASAEELFDAWLDPDSVAEWMRPSGIERTRAVIDARIGGSYEITMLRGSGPLLHRGVYREIDRPRRLVFTWRATGPLEKESLVTVEFHPHGRATEVVVTHERLPAGDVVPSVNAGWTQAIERLAQIFETQGGQS